ncbi:aldo/keto reductase [Enterococcus faecium]|nr:aldo/keto reductase [Enterococcus faecium]EMF0369247.1 aldo/keto reductase [Enterococcus faecium]
MAEIRIGHSQVYAEQLGLGANAVGGHNLFDGLEDETGKQVVRTALNSGINLIDTAYAYGNGRSEELIGEVLKEKEYDRSRIVIATKAAHVPNKGRTFDNSPEFLKQSVEDALKRLQTDYIDIFYIHFPDKSTPKNEAVAALHELKEANTDGYVDVVEDKYSLIHRQAEKELFPYLEKNKISFVPYFPLASGLLTGKYERGQEKQFSEGDPRKSNPDFQGERFKEILAAVDILRPIAKRYQATPAQLVLAWYMKNPRVSVVIPGAKRPEQVSDNVQALDLHLSSEDYQTIDEAFHGF